MRKNKTFLLIGLLIFSFILFSGCKKKENTQIPVKKTPAEVQESETVSSLFSKIKAKTGWDFSEQADVDFTWFTEKDEKIIKGKQIETKKVKNVNLTVSNFFKEQGFQEDMMNISAGTVIGAVGYSKGNLVCSVVQKISAGEDMKKIGTDAGVKTDVNVRCGELK